MRRDISSSPIASRARFALRLPRRHGVAAIDTVFPDFRNPEGLRREAEDAARQGFAGKMAIHPAQIPIINEVFAPSAEKIAWARAVADAFAAAPDKGAVAVNGVMYDRPHLLHAEQLLAQVK